MSISDEFDTALIETIDRTLKYVFGDRNTKIIYEYLERKSCPVTEIPRKLDVFSFELREILGSKDGQIHCSTRARMLAPILEKAILKELCLKLGMIFDDNEPVKFEDDIKKLRGVYRKESVSLIMV